MTAFSEQTFVRFHSIRMFHIMRTRQNTAHSFEICGLKGLYEDWHSYTRFYIYLKIFLQCSTVWYVNSISLIFCYNSKEVLKIPAIKPNLEVLEQFFIFIKIKIFAHLVENWIIHRQGHLILVQFIASSYN